MAVRYTRPIQCIVNGEENPRKLPPSAWDCVTPLEEDRATAIGNMHKKGKDRVCASADRQTHIRAHHTTSSPLPK